MFVAPTDLSSDMGLPGQIRHPDVVDMVDQAGKTIRAAGVSSGMLALNSDDYIFWRERGFQVMCGVAHTFFTVGAQSLMRTVVEHELDAKFHNTGPLEKGGKTKPESFNTPN